MGWQRMDLSGHEGYVVGYVPWDWTPAPEAGASVVLGWPAVAAPANELVRELGGRAEDRGVRVEGVLWVAAGCACGWRGRAVRLDAPAVWMPCMVEPIGALEVELRRQWGAHAQRWARGVAAAAERPLRLPLGGR